MGDSVEDLLAQIKAQYAESNQDALPQPRAEQPPSSQVQKSSAQPSLSSQSGGLPASESIDDLLAEIEGKPVPRQSQRSPAPLNAPQTDWQQIEPSSNQESNQEFANQKISGIANPLQSSPETDRVLQDLKTQYDEHDRAEALKQQAQLRAEEQKRQAQLRAEEQKRQEQLRQEQLRQAELKRQKQIAAAKQAEEWLKRLNPRSGEAAWFEEFATKYESKLEAAIDYLGLETQ